MYKNILFFFSLLFVSLSCLSQRKEGVTHTGQLTKQRPHPITSYQELPNPVATNLEKWKGVQGTKVGWGSTDVRYKKEEPAFPVQADKTIDLYAWKGERVAAQWVVWGNKKINRLHIIMQAPRNSKSGDSIPLTQCLRGFVRYVMTDQLNLDGRGGCGHRPNPAKFDSTLVADPIDHLSPYLSLQPYSTQPGWIGVWVPANAEKGIYLSKIKIKDGNKLLSTLNLRIHVGNRQIPKPDDWTFHLDLWQNPFAIARYHHVRPWSKKHFECMKPYMELYKNAGGKTITTSIIHKPWNGQTYDPFETMVTWIKKADGTWLFDYTIFDSWVQFMMDLGINKEITCYSMVPWKMSFQYYDQATNSLKEMRTEPGQTEYTQLWTTMLRSFAKHLKEKGWFDITHISMDERPLKVMKKTIKVIRNVDPDFKISLAGALHEQLSDELDDYCVALRMKYSEEMKDNRKKDRKITTFYTSCEEPFPNTFTFCPPAECEWFAWHAAKEELDGYLRWALNSWVIEPLLDSRFYTWAAGDTYLIYPGARTSMRFERLIQGIQAYEKINILRTEYEHDNNTQKLQEIKRALDLFDENKLPDTTAAQAIMKAKQMIGL